MDHLPVSPRPTTLLAWMLHVVPLVGVVTFGLSILGACISAIWLVSGWVTTLENLLITIQKSEIEEHDQIKVLQQSMIDVDKRINQLAGVNGKADSTMEAELLRLHAESEAADAQLRARIDVLEAMSRFAIDRALQQPIPTPYVPPAQGGRR